MRRRLVKEKPAGNVSVERLPEVVPPAPAADERPISPGASGVSARLRPPTSLPSPLFSSAALANNADNKRVLDLREKKKLRCIWLAPDKGDQQIVRPPPLDSMQYANLATSRFGQSGITKIQRTDALAAQLEKTGRFMDTVHTYEQSTKMLLRCIQKRAEAHDVAADEIKWLRIDYEIRCVQLVALCLCGARKSEAIADNTPFLFLKKGEDLTSRDGLDYCKKAIQRAAVCQHLANYYKKQKKYQAALQAADKSVHINEKLPPRDRFPMAYFLKACLHGLLNDPSNAGLMYTQCLALAESQQVSRTTGGPGGVDPQALEVFNTLKAATLHNMAIEWANLHMPDQTREALASAMEIGVHRLPQSHPIVVRILETYKVMWQNFLFRRNSLEGSGGASCYLPTAPAASPRRSDGDPSASRRPVAPTPPRGASPRPLNQLSPRNVRDVSSGDFEPDAAVLTPSRPPSRPADSSHPSMRVSSRARTAKRPATTPEGPVGLSGHALPPGATRTSLVVATPKETYSHALGARYNPHKSYVRAEAKVFVIRTRAATKMQKCWRRALARHRLRMLQNDAATLIQSLLRMHTAKSRYQGILDQVRCIQALWRGALARSQQKERVFASVAIQAAWRAKSERDKFEHEKAQIVLLQSLYRGFVARKDIAEQMDAAKKIQAHARRHLEEVNYKKATAAAEVLNRAFRGMYARQVEYPKAVAAAKKREEEEREAEKREEELLEAVAGVLATMVLSIEDTLLAEAKREKEQREAEKREVELVEAVADLLSSMALSLEDTVTTEEPPIFDAIDSKPAEVDQSSSDNDVPEEEISLAGNEAEPDDGNDDTNVAVPSHPMPALGDDDQLVGVDDDEERVVSPGIKPEAPSDVISPSQPSLSASSETANSTGVPKTVRMDALLAKSDSNRLIIDAIMSGTISNYVEASVKAAIEDSSDPSAPYNATFLHILSHNNQEPLNDPSEKESVAESVAAPVEALASVASSVESVEAAVVVPEPVVAAPSIDEDVLSAVDALVSDMATASVAVVSPPVEEVAAAALAAVDPEAEAVVEGVVSEVVAADVPAPAAAAAPVPVEAAVMVPEPVVAAPSIDEDVSSVVDVMVSAVVGSLAVAASVDVLLSDDEVVSRDVDLSEEYDASDEMSIASSTSASSLASNMSHFRLLMATDPGVSIDEVYVDGLISECTGDLEDLDDALSEVFDELHGPGESPGSSPRRSSSQR